MAKVDKAKIIEGSFILLAVAVYFLFFSSKSKKNANLNAPATVATSDTTPLVDNSNPLTSGNTPLSFDLGGSPTNLTYNIGNSAPVVNGASQSGAQSSGACCDPCAKRSASAYVGPVGYGGLVDYNYSNAAPVSIGG